MAKQREYFSFPCKHGPDMIMDRLQEQVKLLEDREYLLRETENGFELGIGRGGHGAGYWYSAQVHEDGVGSRISGRVLHRHHSGRVSEVRDMNLWDHLGIFLVSIIFFPIVIGSFIRQKLQPEPTMEERFVEYMRLQMDCELME